jgi:hydrogenase expression/formation protein HypC
MCVGMPGRILNVVDAEKNLATADFNGVRRIVNIALIVSEDRPASACVGDWVLVHVGFAMTRIDEAQAAETLAILRELGQAQDELEAMAGQEV